MNLFLADSLFALNQLTLLAAAGSAGGLYLFARGFRLLARKRLLLNTPTSKVRSASLGLVEVSGLATGPYTLPTPIAGRPCFLYRTTAWQQDSDSGSREWKKVAEETLRVPFFLDDRTGQLLIEPRGAELDLHRDFRQDFSDTIFSPHTTPQMLSFLARHGVKPKNKLRIEEYSIQPLDPLFIVGTITENPGIEVSPHGAASDYRPGMTTSGPPMPPPEVVRLSQPATLSNAREVTQQSKIAAALLKAGVTSPAAWEAAGVSYSSAQSTSVQEISVTVENKSGQVESHFDLTPPVVLMKGDNNPAFVISWRSQHELVRSLAWKSAAMIWCGGALTLLGIYVFLQQFDLL